MTRRARRFIEQPIMSVITVKRPLRKRTPDMMVNMTDRRLQAIIGSEVIPPVKPELFRERKELGICNRSAAFRHHCGDFCFADLRSCGRAAPVSIAHRK